MHATTQHDHGGAADPGHASEEPATLSQLFDELNRKNWPARLLQRRLSDVLLHVSALHPSDRCAWVGGLQQAWARHGWALGPDDKKALLELSAAWCAWPLTRAICASLENEGMLDEAGTLHMIDACRRLGDGDTAIALAVRLQLVHPAKQQYATLHRDLQAWWRWRQCVPVVDGTDWGDGELRLEPLAHHHLSDFAWQYDDPAIAELCCLPHFQQDVDWHRWLDGLYALGDQRIFALLHREWGFIGCVSLIMHGSVGFFYYWLGRDFQGNGLGPRAVSMMLAMAQRDYGMRCCHAKVFDYNTASRRALEKLGFEALGICGVAPDDDELFYRWGEAQPLADVVEELHRLLAVMQSDTRAAMPVLPAGF
jgi:RimJ/RimL family protein N-acetyltransferase